MQFLLSNKTYISCFFGAMVVALVVTPLMIQLAKRIGAVDRPNHRKIHAAPTPLLGGLAIYIGMWVPVASLVFLDNTITQSLEARWWQFAVVWAAGTLMLICGVWDDLKGLNATKKLAFQLPIAIVFAVFIESFDTFEWPGLPPMELGNLAVPVTVLWIIGIANAINLIDGIDGLATGVAFVIALTTAILAVVAGNHFLALVMLALGGACLGFLRHNFAPAKVFLGDTGSLFIGMTLATTSVLANGKSQIASSMLVAVIILGYPIADTLLAITRRALHGKPILNADKGHIHHRLLASGFDHRRAALIIYGFSLILSLLALSIVAQNNSLTIFWLVVVAALMTFGLHFLGFFRPFLPKHVRDHRPRFLVAYHLGGFVRAKFSLVTEPEDVYGLMRDVAAEFDMQTLEIEIDTEALPNLAPTRFSWRRSGYTAGQTDTLDAKGPVRRELHFHSKLGVTMRVKMDATLADTDLGIEYRQQLSNLLDAAAMRLQQISDGAGPDDSAAALPVPTPGEAAIDPSVSTWSATDESVAISGDW